MNSQVERSSSLRGTWLTTARILWVVLAVGYLALWLASLPGFYERVSTLTVEPFRLGERVIFDNDIARREAIERGMSLQAAAIYDIASNFIQVLVYYSVATVILARASNGFGWFTALVLMLFSVNNMERAVGVAPPFSGATLLMEIPTYIIWPLWILWLVLFPNGRLVPRRAFLPLAVAIAAFLVLQLASVLAVAGAVPPQIDTLAATTWASLGTLPVLGFVLFSQIYRYRRVSTLVERQQTKWFLFGIGAFFAGVAAFVLMPEPIKTSSLLPGLLSGLFLFFPLSVAVAITRYRLFDIDLIIRRTLIYGALTATLARFYLGSVVVLQQVLRGITSEGSDIAIIVSTLAVAALFAPLRRRIQEVIDRRFYRRKYDATHVLTRFGQTARDEVDLNQLTSELLSVVGETLQPASVNLWLKPTNERVQRTE